MRQKSRELECCCKVASKYDRDDLVDKPLEEFIKPQHFDIVAEAAIMAACGSSEDYSEERLKSPSTAIKLGYDLARVATSKMCVAIKERN